MDNWETFLKDYFLNVSNPGAYTSPNKIYQVLKKQGVNITLKQIRKYLKQEDAYSLHRFVKEKRGGVSKTVPLFLDSHWQIDLASFQNIQHENEGVNYLLVCIDVLSRYLWIRPLKTKTHQEVINQFDNILSSSKRKCEVLISDNGKEFANQYFRRYLNEKNIYFYTSNTNKKAAICERVIQTYKGMLYKYFTHKRTHHYLDVYQKLVDNYNSTPHSSLNNLSPREVNENNQSLIWKQIYIDIYDKKPRRKFKKIQYAHNIGDYVRVSYLKKAFVRSYQQKWTDEIFIIHQRYPFKARAAYKLIDFKKDEQIKGIFYEDELQGVDKNTDVEYYIDKVIKRRKLKGREAEVLVSWVGWPSPKFDDWIPASAIKDYERGN